MPELPEVETVVRSLVPRAVGRVIGSVALRRSDIVTPGDVDLPSRLTGRTIRSIHRRAKRIIFLLDDGNRFYIHLGMTGRLTAATPEEPMAKHTHLTLCLARDGEAPASCVHFCDPRRFGGVWWLGSTQAVDEKLGPEPLGVRPKQLAARLAKTTRAIKNALLDQAVIAGLGNIYVDESLFRSCIHPLTRADQLTIKQISALNRAIKYVLRRAIRHRGSTLRDYRDADGESGSAQLLHAVYDREGEPCRRCRTPIKRIVIGGRSTHFCPKCQPEKPST